MLAMMLLPAIVVMMLSAIIEGTNLLVNPSFEDYLKGNWQENGFTMSRHDQDKVHGQYSLLCANRQRELDGPYQDVTGLQMGRGYEFRAHLKLMNDVPGKLWQNVKAVVKFSFTMPVSDTGPEEMTGDKLPVGSYVIAYNGFVTASQGWHILAGSISAPMLTFREIRLQIRGPDPGVNYLLDNLTLVEVPENVNWFANSHRMIDEARKSNVTLRFDVPPSLDPSEIVVQIKHKRHLFAFGSKVEDDLMRHSGPQNEAYRAIFFNLFNWAIMSSYKWRFDNGPDVWHPDFNNAYEAVEILRANNIKVRAHSLFWGMEENIPDAVLQMNGDELRDVINFRTDYMMNLTKGKVVQWDIQNEYLSGHFFEERLQDPNVTMDVFKRAGCPWSTEFRCYLNDYQAINAGGNTEDYVNIAKRFIAAGAGIYGLGIQGHVKDFVKPDPTMIWLRIDRLASVGLELMITEFDVGWDDDVVRADWLEDAMRAYFAHQALSGVILWGYWKERQRYKNEYLFYGDDLRIAEPGERFVCLTQKEWTTSVTRSLGSESTVTFRGFQGDYEVLVKRDGEVVQRESFFLGKQPLVLQLNVTEYSVPVSIKEKVDYVPTCISHRNRMSLGVRTSSSDNATLICRSAQYAGTSASVSCDAGEVMTGCYSRALSPAAWWWRGERVVLDVVSSGVATCFAQSGINGGVVEVSARCCRQAGLECDYRQAGPSQPFDGAMAEAVCPDTYLALGCSSYSQHSTLDGAYPHDRLRSCYAQSGPPISDDPAIRSGAISLAVCCKKLATQCHVVKTEFSQPITELHTGVTCPDEHEVMTGCSAFAENGLSTSVAISADDSGTTRCRANQGGSTAGGTTLLTITCCR